MGKILVMDHLLQEGGYMRDWNFGKPLIHDIVEKLTDCGIDIINLGYLRDEKPSAHRTVYPSVRRLSKAIGFKKYPIRYAVTIDMEEPIEAAQLDERRNGIVDILCVTLRKERIKQELKYLKALFDKGYFLCITLTGIHQYTQKELASVIKMLTPLAPFTLCLRDQFAALTSEQTKAYFDTADNLLPNGCALAYCPTTTSIYTSQNIHALAMRDTKREIWLMTADISRTMDMLPLHTVMDWPETGKRLNRKAVEFLFDSATRFLMDGTCVTIAMYAEQARQFGCDPDYAYYYCRDLSLSLKETKASYQVARKFASPLYTKARAQKALRTYRHNLWKKKLAVIIPTANRPESIEYYLQTIIEKFDDYGIDFIVYDSSNDEKTKDIVKKYQKKGYGCLKYERFDGEYDGYAIDNKVIEAYKSHCDRYEYLWLMRDGLIINIPMCASTIYEFMVQKYDLIIINDYCRASNVVAPVTEYTDCSEVFRDQIHQMTALGMSIVSSAFIQKIIKNQPLDKTLNWGMWQPIAFYHYFAKHPAKIVSYIGTLFLPNIVTRKNAFWTRHLLWQWAERWYTMIDRLPVVYNRYKPIAWRIEMSDFHPFWPWYLVSARAYGGLTWKKYFQNKEYLPYVCDTAKWKFIGALLLPSSLCRRMLEKSEDPFSRFMHWIYKGIVKIYHGLRK